MKGVRGKSDRVVVRMRDTQQSPGVGAQQQMKQCLIAHGSYFEVVSSKLGQNTDYPD
jgi:hypothetical protein